MRRSQLRDGRILRRWRDSPGRLERPVTGATRRWIILFSVLGALRVLLFAVAYPVFDFIDEGLHADVVMKFAYRGLPGRGDDGFYPEAALMMATQGQGQLAPPYG